jgi:membrane-associated PAP2 superfamily phosphatase
VLKYFPSIIRKDFLFSLDKILGKIKMPSFVKKKWKRGYVNKELKNTILLLLIAIFISIIINQLQIDMKLQSLFFQDGVWTHKNDEPWQFLYDYGNIPALILSISGFLLLLASYYVKKYIPYRKVALYLIVVMVVGPGLITNSILKDQWGRPRPRNIVEFNGKYEFEPVLTIDVESKGKSFPCGHATMGFYFFALYFLLISKRRKLAFFFFWVAILYGGIIGLARIVQGGHFLSDVIWAGIVVFLTAKWFYIAFNPDKIQFEMWN